MRNIDDIRYTLNLVRNLNEQLESGKNVILERGGLMTMAAKEGKIVASDLKGTFADLIKSGTKAEPLLTRVGVKNSDDLLKLITNDFKQLDNKLASLSAKEASTLRAEFELSILKNPSGAKKELLDIAASNLVKDSRFLDKYKQYGRETDFVEALKKNGYSEQAANALAKARSESKLTVRPKVDQVTPPVKPKIDPVPLPIKPRTWHKRAWDWLTKSKWGRRVMIGGSLLIAYLIWKSLTDEDGDLSECLKGYVTDEQQFEDFLNNKYIIVNGIQINVDGTAKSGDKSGTWEDKGNGVLVTFDDGSTENIECRKVADPCPPPKMIDPNTGKCSSGGGGGKWKDCSTFPLTRGCQSELVKNVQECIGVVADGKFGPRTEAKLIEKGYETTITQEVYDKIMKNCRGEGDTNTTTTTTYPFDPVYADDSDLD